MNRTQRAMTKKIKTMARNKGIVSAADTEGIIETASAIAKAIQPSLGAMCEIVVHDFSDLDRSVVAYEGNLTGRGVGSPVTPLSLELINAEERPSAISDRMLSTSDGRIIKSTVVALRNEHGHLVGSFCLNLDVSNLKHALNLLEDLAGAPEQSKPYTFPENLPQLLDTVLDQEERKLGRSLVNLDAKQRLTVIESLEQHRIFEIRNSVNLIAERFSVSRATIYTDLEKVRKKSNAA